MKIRKGDRQYYLNKEGDTFHLVKRVKTFSKSATLGKTKATVKTVADLVFHEKECAEIFSMSPRTWRRKEEPVGTASGTALTPVEFKFLLLLAGEHPDYVLCKRNKKNSDSGSN